MNHLSNVDFRKLHQILHMTHIYVFSIGQVEKKLSPIESSWILPFFLVFMKLAIFRVTSLVLEITVTLSLLEYKCGTAKPVFFNLRCT